VASQLVAGLDAAARDAPADAAPSHEATVARAIVALVGMLALYGRVRR
jgi:hypothetical protein